MTDLFIVTSFNETMADLIFSSNDPLVITANPQLYEEVFSGKVRSILIGYDDHPFDGQDAQFAQDFMPGYLGKALIPDTKLPAWKVLSLDRLKFFYSFKGDKAKELIHSLKWDRVYTSFDMGNQLPMVAMWEAKARGAECIAVKTEPLRTIEILDLAPLFWFTGFIVDNAGEASFLRKAGLRKKTEIHELGIETSIRVESPSREGLRTAFGIKGKVLGILFDKRDEWQTATFISTYILHGGEYERYIILPVDARSAELAPVVLPDFVVPLITGNMHMLNMCDEIIAFRWDDNFCYSLPANLRILDYRGVNRAIDISPVPEIVTEI